MANSLVDGDLTVRGTLNVQTFVLPANSLQSSSQVLAGANISADKTEQRIFPSWQQPSSAATTETRAIYVARRDGTLNEVIAGSIAKAGGNATVTIDVRKNGTTVLASVITLNSSSADRIVQSGSVSSAAFVAGDWFEVVIVAAVGSGTLPTGVYCQLEIDQDGT